MFSPGGCVQVRVMEVAVEVVFTIVGEEIK